MAAPATASDLSSPEAPTVHASFMVQTMSDAKQVDVLGETLGDLRQGVKLTFGIPRFQQKILYANGEGDSVELAGDDSVLLKEKIGLLDAKELQLARQVDPRYKTEKETAFLQALAACRFDEAKEILEDEEGAVIDPNCVYKGCIRDQGGDKWVRIGVSECPRSYRHPALTVAMIAGLEYASHWQQVRVQEIQEWMSRENEVGEVVELLIQRRADVNAVGDEALDAESAGCPSVNGKSPLCAAVQRGSPFLVRMLLNAKADPNHTVTLGGSAWGAGPGMQRPGAYVNDISNGSMTARDPRDPRNLYQDEILEILRVASEGTAASA